MPGCVRPACEGVWGYERTVFISRRPLASARRTHGALSASPIKNPQIPPPPPTPRPTPSYPPSRRVGLVVGGLLSIGL